MRNRIILSALMTIFLLTSGCGGITLGPKAETQVVIVRPGDPVQLLSNRTMKGRSLKTEKVVDVDVGGWIAMPREHFEALQRALEK